MADLNVWGTDKALVNSEEFCVECEREVPYHYENCPTGGKRYFAGREWDGTKK